jgi:hypothetical protein
VEIEVDVEEDVELVEIELLVEEVEILVEVD